MNNNTNCFVSNIQEDKFGSIKNNSWYYTTAGHSMYPYDEITGYTMYNLERKVVKYSTDISTLRAGLIRYMPGNITLKHIDVYLELFENLN